MNRLCFLIGVCATTTAILGAICFLIWRGNLSFGGRVNTMQPSVITKEENILVPEWKTYTDDRGFSIQYPKGWSFHKDDGSVGDIIALIQSIQTDGQGGPLVILIRRYPKNNYNTVAQLVSNDSPDQHSGTVQDVLLFSTFINGNEAKAYAYKHISAEGIHTIEKEYIVDGKSYIYTISTFINTSANISNKEQRDVDYYNYAAQLIAHTFRSP